ncbi:MAG: protein kinase, partial [Ferruginibacter sp.]
FNIKETIKVADHLSNALAHCHRADVKHGDIKSNNVKFNQRTGNYILIDFGMSVMSDEQRRTSIRHAGAIEFMAPEQNAGVMLFETDVYSLGIILFELLCGTVPFPLGSRGEMARNAVMLAHLESMPPDLIALRRSALPSSWSINKQEREMQVPAWLIKMISKCLEKEPSNRFSNGIELQEFIHSGMVAEEINLASLVSEEMGRMRTHELKLKNEIVRLELLSVEKENMIEDLQLKVALKDQALYQFQYVENYQQSKQKGISKSLFITVLFIALGLAGFTAYHSFIIPSHKNINADPASNINGKMNDIPDSSNESSTKPFKKARSKFKKNSNAASNRFEAQSNDDASRDEASISLANSNGGKKYQVVSTAFFYNTPNEKDRHDPDMAVRNGRVVSVDEKKDFIYVVVLNSECKYTRGWLLKKNLSPVDH